MSTLWAAPLPLWRRRLRIVLVRAFELTMIVYGLLFFNGDEDGTVQLDYLATWDLLALLYIIVGGTVARRARLKRYDLAADLGGPWPLRVLSHYRSSFIFALVASVIGMTAASSVVIFGEDENYGSVVKVLGVAAMVFAWILLQSGYARFYAGVYFRGGGQSGGLIFPECERPGLVEFLYFAITLGATFAVSDVTVTTPSMRWHVTVHTVLSFFYNSVVLAIAVSILTGK